MKTTTYDLNRSPDHYTEFKKILAFIMGVGIFTIALSLVGCFGAYHESQAILAIYFSVMLFSFASQVAAGSMYFVYKETVFHIFLLK